MKFTESLGEGKPKRPKFRSDKSKNLRKLVRLIEKHVNTAGIKFEGHAWAYLSRTEWASLLGVSERTIASLIKEYPIQRTVTQIDGCKALLLRVGEPSPPTERETTNHLKNMWRKRTGRDISKHEYGLLRGLAQTWPAGYQAKFLSAILADWPSFMVAVDLYQGLLNAVIEDGGEGKKHVKRFYRYPTLQVIRRYSVLGQDMFLNREQANEKDAFCHPFDWTLGAVEKTLWHMETKTSLCSLTPKQ